MFEQLPEKSERAISLILFTREFAEFVNSGINLVRGLDLLGDVPPPLGDAARTLYNEVVEGANLSRSMQKQPDVFSPFYVSMVKAGEVAGALDETLKNLVELLNREWRFGCRRLQPNEPPLWTPILDGPIPHSWLDLSPNQRTFALMEYCYGLGALLSYGAPVLRALNLASDLLPQSLHDVLQIARERIREGEALTPALERLQILPRFAITMIGVGEEHDCLDVTLDKVADMLYNELELRLMR